MKCVCSRHRACYRFARSQRIKQNLQERSPPTPTPTFREHSIRWWRVAPRGRAMFGATCGAIDRKLFRYGNTWCFLQSNDTRDDDSFCVSSFLPLENLKPCSVDSSATMNSSAPRKNQPLRSVSGSTRGRRCGGLTLPRPILIPLILPTRQQVRGIL